MFDISDPLPQQINLVRAVIWVMAPMALTFLLVNFEMAQYRFVMIIPLAVFACIYLAGVAIWHQTIMQVVTVLGVVSLGSAVSLMFCLPWRGRDGTHAHA